MLLPKSVMIGYGGHSETERVLVNNEELTTLNWLEIQSFPFGNIGDAAYMQSKKIKYKITIMTAYMLRSLMEMK